MDLADLEEKEKESLLNNDPGKIITQTLCCSLVLPLLGLLAG